MEKKPNITKIVRDDLEFVACTPHPIHHNGFNPKPNLPYDCTTKHIQSTMQEFLNFLRFVNIELHHRKMKRLESFVMPANFSSIVGEFMSATLPKYCTNLVKNRYHNGHPDLIPARMFPGDAVQYDTRGIEVKASRYPKGWQGHNPENVWLMVFAYESNRPKDVPVESVAPEEEKKIIEAPTVLPLPFRFIKVVAAQLTKADWKYTGRLGESRRTITASVIDSGFIKMERNWIYRDPECPESGMYAGKKRFKIEGKIITKLDQLNVF